MDLTEPMAQNCRLLVAAPNTCISDFTSALSPATVPVPWASIKLTVAGEKPAFL